MSEPGEDGAIPRAERLVVRLDLRSAVWIVVGLLVAFAVFGIVDNTEAMLTKVVIGAVLALALDGVVQSIAQRWRLGRSASVAVVGMGLLGLALLIVLVLGPPAVEQARQFSQEIPETVEEFYDLPVVGPVLERNDAKTKAQEWIEDLPANISDDAIARTADRLIGGVFSIVVVVVTTFALLLDGERLVNRGRRLVPARHREQADRIGRTVYRTFGRYFGGSITVAALMGLYVLSLGLIFDIPLAPLAALWAMLTDLIPQIGGFLGGAFLFVLAVSTGVGTAVIVTALFVVYMNLENHVISPAIVGQAVNLSPPTTMLAAFIGGAAAGIPGALIATPLVGAAKQLYMSTRHGDDPAEDHRRPGRFRAWIRRRLRRPATVA